MQPCTYPLGSPGGKCSQGKCVEGAKCRSIGGVLPLCLHDCSTTSCPRGGFCMASTGYMCRCTKDSDCQAGSSCNNLVPGKWMMGACAAGPSRSCPSGWRCERLEKGGGFCVPDRPGTIVQGGRCGFLRRCAEDLTCITVSGVRRCVAGCGKGRSCPPGTDCGSTHHGTICLCRQGRCTGGRTCVMVDQYGGVCVNLQQGTCLESGECPVGYACVGGKCKPRMEKEQGVGDGGDGPHEAPSPPEATDATVLDEPRGVDRRVQDWAGQGGGGDDHLGDGGSKGGCGCGLDSNAASGDPVGVVLGLLGLLAASGLRRRRPSS